LEKTTDEILKAAKLGDLKMVSETVKKLSGFLFI
jgi:hypothetical protein